MQATQSGVTATLTYDPLGRLWQAVKGSSDTRFVYDGDAMILEYDAAGSILNRYVHGSNAAADDPLVWYPGSALSTKKWLHADHLGSIVAATDTSGGNPTINRYDEYGVPASTNAGRFQYTGQVWLSEIGLYYYKARMYDPRHGRFMQTDPIGYDGGINLYGYVEEDPTNRADPTGNLPFYDPVRANLLRGGYSYFAHIAASWRHAYDLAGLSGPEAQNRARLVDELAARALNTVWNHPQDVMRQAEPYAKAWLENNKAFMVGRVGAMVGVPALTGPVAGPALNFQAAYGAAANALNSVVSQLERGGFDSSKLSNSTLGMIAAVGIAGGSLQFNAKTGDLSARVKSIEINSRIPQTRTIGICNVNSKEGC